jgi:hypothetical protein
MNIGMGMMEEGRTEEMVEDIKERKGRTGEWNRRGRGIEEYMYNI